MRSFGMVSLVVLGLSWASETRAQEEVLRLDQVSQDFCQSEGCPQIANQIASDFVQALDGSIQMKRPLDSQKVEQLRGQVRALQNYRDGASKCKALVDQMKNDAESKNVAGKAGVDAAIGNMAEMKKYFGNMEKQKPFTDACHKSRERAATAYGACIATVDAGARKVASGTQWVRSCVAGIKAARKQMWKAMSQYQASRDPKVQEIFSKIKPVWAQLNTGMDTNAEKPMDVALSGIESSGRALAAKKQPCTMGADGAAGSDKGCTGTSTIAEHLKTPKEGMPDPNAGKENAVVANNPAENPFKEKETPKEALPEVKKSPDEDRKLSQAENWDKAARDRLGEAQWRADDAERRVQQAQLEADRRAQEAEERANAAIENANRQAQQQQPQQQQQPESGQGGEQGQGQQGQQQASTPKEQEKPKTPDPAVAKAEAEAKKAQAALKAAQEEADKAKKELDNVKGTQDALYGGKSPNEGSSNSGNSSENKSSSTKKELASDGAKDGAKKNDDKANGTVGARQLAGDLVPAPGSFTAYKNDCNTGLGSCSRVPIACVPPDYAGLSAEDAQTCKNEAAKRDAKRQKALSSEFLKSK